MPMVTKQKRVMCDIRVFEKLLVFIGQPGAGRRNTIDFHHRYDLL